MTAASDLVSDLPSYVSDLNDTVQGSETLRNLNENFDLVSKLEDVANNAAGSLDDVAGTLADLGAGLLGSLFALFTILVMSIFMVSRGQQWTEAVLATRPARGGGGDRPGAEPDGDRGLQLRRRGARAGDDRRHRRLHRPARSSGYRRRSPWP